MDDKPITWTELKESETGTTWSQGNITLKVLFKYNQGGFPRFIYEDKVEYFHFI